MYGCLVVALSLLPEIASMTLSDEEAKKHQERLFHLDPAAESTIIAISSTAWIPGLIFFVLFLVLRRWLHRVYSRREFVGETVIDGSWIRHMLFVSPEEAFSSGYSTDGCMHILAWTTMLKVSLCLLVLSPLPLLINWYGAGFSCPGDEETSYEADGKTINCGPGIDYKGDPLSSFEKLTMSGFQKGNSLVWGHVVTLWIITFIVIWHLRRANAVFISLRSKWFRRRPKSVANSLMAVNVTSRSDTEFRDLFEKMFPGKVVDARLVKFCEPLAKTCAKLKEVEEKIDENTQIAEEKNAAPVDKADSPKPNDNKVVAVFKKLIGPGLEEERAMLLQTKAQEQKELSEKCKDEIGKLPSVEKLDAIPTAKYIKSIKKLVQSDAVYSKIGFVTFTDLRTATLASQAAYSTDSTEWIMRAAPEPEDVLWEYMASHRASTNQTRTYVIVIGAIALFLLSFPIVTIVQGFVDQGTNKLTDEFPDLKEHALFNVVNPIVQTLVLLIFLAILPVIFYRLSLLSGRVVETTVFLDMQFYMFLFNVVFVIYASSLGVYATSLGKYVLGAIGVLPAEKQDALDWSNAFGVSVPSRFPTHYTFAAKSFFGLGFVLFQLSVLVAFAIQRFLLRKPRLFSWRAASKKSTLPRENATRFVTLAVLLTIGLMIYLVFPLNSILFCALFLFGCICYRYRVLYVDSNLVDSGGLYWADFQILVVVALILTQISACLTLTSIETGMWITLATFPLPIICGVVLLNMRRARWEFLLMQETSTELEEGVEFQYVQPQLASCEVDKTSPQRMARERAARVGA